MQYIIIPTRRSTAEAVQILVSHLLGDAGSPWLVGEVRGTNGLQYIQISLIRTPKGQSLVSVWTCLNYKVTDNMNFGLL